MTRMRRMAAAAAAAALLAAGFTGTTPAGAGDAATCTATEDVLGPAWEISTPPGTVVLSSNGSDLLVNGTVCGPHRGLVIVEVVGLAPLQVLVDGSRPWRAGALLTTVNIRPTSSAGSSVTFKGSSARDEVGLLVGTQGFATWSNANVHVTVHDQSRYALDFDLAGGNDQFTMAGRHIASVRVRGGAGNDSIGGDQGREVLSGGPGLDRIDGGGSNDRIDGGPGRDRVTGGPGIDQFSMRDGTADRIDGGPGNDTCDCDGSDITVDL